MQRLLPGRQCPSCRVLPPYHLQTRAGAPHIMSSQSFFDTSPSQVLTEGCTHRGHAYQRALTLARKEAPDKAASVQAAWGAWLSSQGKYLEAVRHLLEAGQPEAALDAATAARNWDAAADILQNMVIDCAPMHCCT